MLSEQSINDFMRGQRVRTMAHTDAWMRGDRFGTVVHVGRRCVSVKLDRSGRTVRFPPSSVTLNFFGSDA